METVKKYDARYLKKRGKGMETGNAQKLLVGCYQA